MFRLFASTCSVLVEVAALEATAPASSIILATAGLIIAMTAWGTMALTLADRLVGLDQ